MTRKGFLAALGLLSGAGVCRGAAGGRRRLQKETAWEGWTKGHFQVHFIYTGCGEQMFLIFPDGTTMLLDCGDSAAMTRGDLAVPILPREPFRLGGDWVARYVARVNPNGKEIDYLMLTHWHADHGGCRAWQTVERSRKVNWWSVPYWRSGFGIVFEDFKIARLIDRGYPDYNDPLPQKVPGDVQEHWRRLAQHVVRRDRARIEKFRLGATDQIVPLRGEAADFSVFNICGNGRLARPDGTTVDCYAERLAETPKPTYLNENGMSLGMVFTYGKFRFFAAGDFSDRWKRADGTRVDIEERLAEVVPPCHVAKLNHHGHYSMPAALVKALRSRVWVSCVWDVLHSVAPVMARLSDRTLYDGERLICPGVFPARRLKEDAGAAWLKDVAPASFDGGHVVLDVEPGGERYTVSYLRASDESMTVVERYAFETQDGGAPRPR